MFRRAVQNKASAGFTLVEVIVVVVLLSIAAAVVVPQALDTSDLQAMSAARMIASDLEYARDLAITSTDRVTVTFAPSTETYQLTNTSGAIVHPITKAASYAVDFRTTKGFERVDLVSANFDGAVSVVFDETGAPTSINQGIVTVQAGSVSYQIRVDAGTGRVSVN